MHCYVLLQKFLISSGFKPLGGGSEGEIEGAKKKEEKENERKRK